MCCVEMLHGRAVELILIQTSRTKSKNLRNKVCAAKGALRFNITSSSDCIYKGDQLIWSLRYGIHHTSLCAIQRRKHQSRISSKVTKGCPMYIYICMSLTSSSKVHLNSHAYLSFSPQRSLVPTKHGEVLFLQIMVTKKFC